MAQVFISFIHEEIAWAAAVQGFIGQMLGSEAEPFLSSDKFQVYAGEKWLDRIMDELESAKVVLLMLSNTSVKRPWVNFEAGAAWTRDIITIPVCFGGMEKANLPKPYSSLQAIDLEETDDQQYLARSVAHHLGLREPMIPIFGMSLSAIAGLGGPESVKIAKREDNAYQLLRDTLASLREDPAE